MDLCKLPPVEGQTGVSRFYVLVGAVLVFLTACGGAPDSTAEADVDGPFAMTNDALVNGNALNMNALNMNALNMNALNMNALNMNALAPQTLAAIQSPTENGSLARQLLLYTVSCALDASQSVTFTWTDLAGAAHDETYVGLLGLAPHWASGKLSLSGQQWVSACLISRVNWYGVPVSLSSRGDTSPLNPVSDAEASLYTAEEGAFWGNLFAAQPVAYACDNGSNAAHSRSRHRDCAAGHLDAENHLVDCGMIHRVGSCAAHCTTVASDGVHPMCASGAGPGGAPTSAVVTVFLQ